MPVPNKLVNKSANRLTPSPEQAAIVDAVIHRKSVVVDAVAGSGKTTTVKFILERWPQAKILLITYSKRLRLELKTTFGTRLTVHNYHSIACNWYHVGYYTDRHLETIIGNNMHINRKISFDVVVIDEIQDMNLVYYKFILRFLGDVTTPPTLLIMGDRRQGIYQFRGSDPRYLVLAHIIFPLCYDAALLTLRQSFRVTTSMAWFVNQAVLGEPRINSIKQGPPVDYYIGDPYSIGKLLAEELHALKIKRQLNDDDIFVLANSTKSQKYTPIRHLLNELSVKGMKCHLSDDDTSLNDEATRNKVVFTTFHQSKGLERKVVIIYGFDNGYYQWRNVPASENRTVCPPCFYVALTRATQRLIIIDEASKEQIPFLKLTYSAMEESGHVTFPLGWEKQVEPCIPYYKSDFTVTDLVRQVELTPTMAQLVTAMFHQEVPPGPLIDIPSLAKTAKMCEEVSDLNALAVSFAWEHMHTGEVKTFEYVKDEIREKGGVIKPNFVKTITGYSSTQNFLRMANLCQAHFCKVVHRLIQITDYTWLKPEMANACIRHLNHRIPWSDGVKLEKVLRDRDSDCVRFTTPYGVMKLHGRVDVCTDNIVWEVKCVNTISLEHYLQVIVYAFMWDLLCERGVQTYRVFKLINVRSGEVFRLNHRYLDDVVNYLVAAKLTLNHVMTNQEFIAKCREVNPLIPQDLQDTLENGDMKDEKDDSDESPDHLSELLTNETPRSSEQYIYIPNDITIIDPHCIRCSNTQYDCEIITTQDGVFCLDCRQLMWAMEGCWFP